MHLFFKKKNYTIIIKFTLSPAPPFKCPPPGGRHPLPQAHRNPPQASPGRASSPVHHPDQAGLSAGCLPQLQSLGCFLAPASAP